MVQNAGTASRRDFKRGEVLCSVVTTVGRQQRAVDHHSDYHSVRLGRQRLRKQLRLQQRLRLQQLRLQ